MHRRNLLKHLWAGTALGGSSLLLNQSLTASSSEGVETPMMQPIPGGATARPFRTHHNALGVDLYLRIAPELYLKRLLVGGYERVYELNRNFRNEGISVRHNPEFSMLEFYIAYRDYQFLISLTEELLTFVVQKTLGTLKVPFEDMLLDFTPPWPRVTMIDALLQQGVPQEIITDFQKAREWARSQNIDTKDVVSLGKLLDELFKEKVEPLLVQPTFIIAGWHSVPDSSLRSSSHSCTSLRRHSCY